MKMMLFLAFTFSITARASIEVRPGKVELVKGDETLCESGAVRIVSDEDNRTLLVGNLQFPLFPEKSSEDLGLGSCIREDATFSDHHSISFHSKVFKCLETHKNLEYEVTQNLKITGENFHYQKIEGNKKQECFFRRSKS